jgi:regulator of RNase E activity RraA
MQAGQVVVIDLGGALTAAAWGGLASRIALARGVRATVVSGCCRDIDEIRAHAYPVWTTGIYPRRSRNEFTFGSIGEPLIVQGVHVNPGDLILADPSGVVRVPRGREAEVLEVAEGIAKAELALAAHAATDSVASWDQI